MKKKVYERPEVTKVEIDFSDRIVAAGCALADFMSSDCSHGGVRTS